MKRKLLSLSLIVVMLFTFVSPAMAAENESNSTDSITIPFSNVALLSISEEDSSTGIESTDVREFFERNEMNYNYYRDWLYEQEMDGLESVTITVLSSNDNGVAPASLNSTIQGDRIVYVDRYYTHNPRTNQFTVGALMKNVIAEGVTLVIGRYSQVVASLASILGITDPDTYFGSDRVRQNKEYYVNDGANRVVTKFVELYAPVSGVTQWYAWGYAESDYVRHGVQLYYKGIENGAKKNLYHQYYTQHYYTETTLVNLVKNAYSMGRTYCEVADDYASAIGGYALYDRNITASKYLEYDSVVIN